MAFRSLLLLAAALPIAMAAGDSDRDLENYKVEKYMVWTWLAIVITLLIYRWTTTLLRHVRLLANLNHGSSSDGRQKYFAIPDETWAMVKRQVIYAPLFRKRHNREFRISDAVEICTLPGRLQTLFLIGYFVMNAALCAITIDWTDKASFYVSAVHRTGCVTVMNMVALFLLAGRNNPLIFLLGISFDTYNLIHRWIGRIVVLEAIAHTAFWMGNKYVTIPDREKASASILKAMASSPLILSGTIGTCAFGFLLFHSPGPIRHAFYETFLHAHILVAALSVGAVWVHLKGLTAQLILLVAIVFWIIERALRLLSLVRRNVGKGVTKAEVEALPGDAVRVTLRIAKPWRFRPGQHIYLYVPSLGLWTSHPFSLVWSEEEDGAGDGKSLPVSRLDVLSRKKTSMSLVIRRRTGFTDKLFKRAEMSPAAKYTTTAFVEGPYGNQSFRSYGTVMLFAAGIGITHQVPHVRDLVAAYANGSCATRKVILVWTIQSPEHLEWIRPWMTQILGMEKRREILKILLFITRPRSTKEIHSPSSSVQMHPGKPQVNTLLEREQDHQVGAMAVSVCGTGSMADDVRQAVREAQDKTEIDFFEEAFSW